MTVFIHIGRNTIMASNTGKRIENVLRWLCLLPACLLGGFIALVLVRILNIWGYRAYYGGDPTGFANLGLEFMGGAIWGVAGMWIASRVAPTKKRTVVVVTGMMFVLLAGVMLLVALSRPDDDLWGRLASIGGMLLGAISLGTEAIRNPARFGIGNAEEQYFRRAE